MGHSMGEDHRARFMERNPDAPQWAGDIAEDLSDIKMSLDGENGLKWRVKELERFVQGARWVLGAIGITMLGSFGLMVWNLIKKFG